ncbi:MAG: fatty acyl-AMP ligase [Microcoleaceae cyanobacterium]
MTGKTDPFHSQTLVELLMHRAIHQPDQTAYQFLVDGEIETVSLTYSQLDQQAKAIAVELQSYCNVGDRALLLYQPSLDYISAFFGCLYAGVIAVPAYPPRPNRSFSRLKAILENAVATAVLTTSPILKQLQRRFLKDQDSYFKISQWLITDGLNSEQATSWQPPDITSESLAFLQYTSGSTAAPKGVMITHGNLLHNLASIYRCFEFHDHSAVMSWLPMYHDMGLIGGVLQPLYAGIPVTLMSPLLFLQRPLRWLQAISRYRIPVSGGPNFAYDLCVRRITPEQRQELDLSCWEVAFNGAEPIYHEVLERFIQAFKPCGFQPEAFYPCYGMAEATLLITGGLKAAPPRLKTVQTSALEKGYAVATAEGEIGRILVGCGQTLKDQTTIIVDPQTHIRCPEGTIGEIWLSGPSVAQGYWQNTEATGQGFKATLTDTAKELFLRTGDLGFLDQGELFVTGRLKDIIIINGCNHYPQDIEWTVEQSHPLIRSNSSAGFSIEVDGEERLVIVAEVERRYRQRRPGAEAASSPPSEAFDPKALIQSIQRAVSKYHDLQVYQALLLKPGTLPKTSSGKIQRYACRAGFLTGTLDVIA